MSAENKKDEIKEIAELLEASLQGHSLGMARKDGFIPRARKYLLERHQRLAPEKSIELPSGKSLLVLMSSNSMDEAIAWEEQVKGPAWAATPSHPHPILSIVSGMGEKQYWGAGDGKPKWPPNQAKKAQIKSFLIRGMLHSMPWRAERELNNDDKGQCQLVEFLQIDDQTLSAQEKLSLFAKAGGVPAFSQQGFSSPPNWKAWIEAGLIGKDTKVLIPERKEKLVDWLEAWEQSLHNSLLRDDCQEVYDHIESLGLDSAPAKLTRMKTLFFKAESWKQARELLDQTPGGWEFEHEKGKLMWQELFAISPGWVEQLEGEQRGRLRMTSSTGVGIWSHILDGLTKGVGKTRTLGANNLQLRVPHIRKLLEKVPLEINDRGVLYEERKRPDHMLEELFDLSFGTSADTWVGVADERQGKRASVLLERLLVGQNKGNAQTREAAAEQALLLLRAWQRDSQCLTNQTKAVVWCLGQYLRQAEGLKLDTDVWNLTHSQLPEPEAGSMDWAREIIEEKGKEHPSLMTMKTILKRAWLGTMAQGNKQGPGTVPKM